MTCDVSYLLREYVSFRSTCLPGDALSSSDSEEGTLLAIQVTTMVAVVVVVVVVVVVAAAAAADLCKVTRGTQASRMLESVSV